MVTIADIIGSNSTVPILFPTGSAAVWMQVIVTGSGTVRLGDSTVNSTNGLPLAAGAGFFSVPVAGHLNTYRSSEFYAYIPIGGTLSVGIKEAPLS